MIKKKKLPNSEIVYKYQKTDNLIKRYVMYIIALIEIAKKYFKTFNYTIIDFIFYLNDKVY